MRNVLAIPFALAAVIIAGIGLIFFAAAAVVSIVATLIVGDD